MSNFIRYMQFYCELAVKARKIRIAEPLASYLHDFEIAGPAVPWQSEPLNWSVASALGGGRMQHIGAAGQSRALA